MFEEILMYFFLFQDMVQVADSLSINPSPTMHIT